jgi:hypothetical protein
VVSEVAIDVGASQLQVYIAEVKKHVVGGVLWAMTAMRRGLGEILDVVLLLRIVVVVNDRSEEEVDDRVDDEGRILVVAIGTHMCYDRADVGRHVICKAENMRKEYRV